MAYGEDYKHVRRMVGNVKVQEQPRVSRKVIADVSDDFKTILRRIEARGLDIPENLVKEILSGQVKGTEVYASLFLITRRGARQS
ncbi:MAG: hypothetical protein QW707_07185 [Candidatus Bathyarchaeia archaeon]